MPPERPSGHGHPSHPSRPDIDREKATDPDLFKALAEDVKAIRTQQEQWQEERGGELDVMSGRLLRVAGVVGEPEVARNFAGDPPIPATGLCFTIARMARRIEAIDAEKKRGTRLSVISAGGAAALITAIAHAVAALQAPAVYPHHDIPPAIVAPAPREIPILAPPKQ